jgi:hypothetical protein
MAGDSLDPPLDFPRGLEPFGFAQDREPVERVLERLGTMRLSNGLPAMVGAVLQRRINGRPYILVRLGRIRLWGCPYQVLNG